MSDKRDVWRCLSNSSRARVREFRVTAESPAFEGLLDRHAVRQRTEHLAVLPLGVAEGHAQLVHGFA